MIVYSRWNLIFSQSLSSKMSLKSKFWPKLELLGQKNYLHRFKYWKILFAWWFVSWFDQILISSNCIQQFYCVFICPASVIPGSKIPVLPATHIFLAEYNDRILQIFHRYILRNITVLEVFQCYDRLNRRFYIDRTCAPVTPCTKNHKNHTWVWAT